MASIRRNAGGRSRRHNSERKVIPKEGLTTEAVLGVMEERRKMFRELNTRIEMMRKEKTEEYLNVKCNENEQIEKSDTRLMAERIRKILGKKSVLSTGPIFAGNRWRVVCEFVGVHGAAMCWCVASRVCLYV